ncbi:MAG: hypothetical protein WDN10_00160 [bacterium]
MRTPPPARVANCAAHFDHKGFKAWRARIDSRTLNIADPGNDVVAHLTGKSFLDRLADIDIPLNQAVSFGLNGEESLKPPVSYAEDCRQLTAAWKIEAARQK